jgi:fucose 4-O-acetylase-like acetyltransferase
MSARMADIDRARGLAILLVVFGHLVAREPPAGAAGYEHLRALVYLFHMPLFFYLSGYTSWQRGPGAEIRWRRAIRRKLLPFAAFGVAVVAGKLLLRGHIPLDNAPPGLAPGLTALFWDTAHSPALSVWFLIALFVYDLGGRVLCRRLGPAVAVAAAAGLYLLVLPERLYLDRIGEYAIFYAAGACAAGGGEAWLGVLDRHRPLFAGGFALALFAAGLGWLGDLGISSWPAAWPYRLSLLVFGLASMPAVHALMRGSGWTGEGVLTLLGRASFPIYLLNTIAIGLAKALLSAIAPWQAANFWGFAALLMLAGVGLPLLLAALQNRLSWLAVPPAASARAGA